jgi:hypothetical protein
VVTLDAVPVSAPTNVVAVTTPVTSTLPRTVSFDVGFVVPMPVLLIKENPLSENDKVLMPVLLVILSTLISAVISGSLSPFIFYYL